MKIVVTGGAGFVGVHLLPLLHQRQYDEIHVIDCLAPTSNPECFGVDGLFQSGITLHQVDICDSDAVEDIFEGAEVVIHLAAETYVDRSIDDPMSFVRVNVEGTVNLLKAASRTRVGRFVHVSTDEVWGHMEKDGRFHESSHYDPRNPYAASKVAADHFVRAWGATWGLDYVIVHFTNLFGSYQFPEKLIPRAIARLLSGRPVEVYGDGRHVRSWLSVSDAAKGLLLASEVGHAQRSYIVGSEEEWSNLQLVEALLEILGFDGPEMVRFVADRPGHDLRYAVNCSRSRTELGWTPIQSIPDGLRQTVAWYRNNTEWLSRRISEVDSRLGLGDPSWASATRRWR